MSVVNVLVVDDASFIRDLIKKCLRGAFSGIGIEEAANGRRAQQLLARQTFDLVLCDWEMPEMSGLELLVWFRSQTQNASTPFIMVTSRGDKENVIQAIQAGVSDYVGKPFTSEQLVTKVKKALGPGRLAALQSAASPALSTGTGGDSLSVLTGGAAPKAEAPRVQPAAAAPARPAPTARVAAKAAPATAAARGQAMLRLPDAELLCLIKAISLKEIVVLVKRGEVVPQILSSVVLDLEQGQDNEVARLNAYVHALSAVESNGEIQWVQAHCRFVDRDPQKLDYISRLIARGTTQRHFTPGA